MASCTTRASRTSTAICGTWSGLRCRNEPSRQLHPDHALADGHVETTLVIDRQASWIVEAAGEGAGSRLPQADLAGHGRDHAARRDLADRLVAAVDHVQVVRFVDHHIP